MTEYVWCHGPKCHTYQTQDRIRGIKGNKVLRTRKIRQNSWNASHWCSHFCSQGCYTDFLYAHWEEFIRLHPRTEPLETPIEVQKIKHEGYDSRWGRIPDRTETKIVVDNNRNP